MGQYGRAACIAADLLEGKAEETPRTAWELAMRRVTTSPSSREKPCPRSTFLGLCEEGLVRGVRPGSYTSSSDNKSYALRAIRALVDDPTLASQRGVLWDLATGGKLKGRNGQLDVVLALWREGRLNRPVAGLEVGST